MGIERADELPVRRRSCSGRGCEDGGDHDGAGENADALWGRDHARRFPTEYVLKLARRRCPAVCLNRHVAALYRKYRPQTFAEVVGQEAVVRTLTNAIEQGK